MDDATAIRDCLNGHPDAFRHVVQRHQGRALAHARLLTGNDADAADAAQEAFVDAFRHLARFDGGREFYPWFYVMLRNRCFKSTGRARRQKHEAIDPNWPAASGLPAEDRVDLRAGLAQLEPADRELIVLKHLDGWTYDELAERLEIPRGTVMSRLFHARQRLQALLEGKPR
jgi:RNA polymerase sigma-70 factor (ECF subfamily)